MVEEKSSDPWPELRDLPMGRRVEFTDGRGQTYTGTVVTRHGFLGDRILQLKLSSGYNVGIRVDPGSSFRLLPDLAREAPEEPSPARPGPAGPAGGWVALLTTGGTIASRVDYETGGVRPVKGEAEILAFYPELERSGPVRIVPVFDRLSEDLRPDDWVTLGGHVVTAFRDGATGVVIAHGTDTLGFTAAGLSFLLADLPGPVVVVGAQRSPDRPSSDGPSNLQAGVQVAREARLGEVVVVMHAGPSDTRFAIHRGTWVRKMHSSRRDAFESRNGPELGGVQDGRVSLGPLARPPTPGPARLDGPIDAHAALLWSFPGLSAKTARAVALDVRGLVLAGTGLGHVASEHLEWIREATGRGTLVAMTTQCLGGRADPFVYATGRDLMAAGVLYLDDLLPETAYAKMVWALGHAASREGVAELLTIPRAGEFLDRHAGVRGP
ncbi:MAG TPA: Glu-tRNA(Gln) amidotransferase subunit GatD [Thermoplasmata archaeon]|nr:Glu-tRNA(Gln) amidotransferase subunit GatD [Thermoplasmata archaeon]